MKKNNEETGLTDAQKKLPPQLQAAILKNKGKHKNDKNEKEDKEKDHKNEKEDKEKDHKNEKEDKKEDKEGLTAAQKKLPPQLQAAILKNKKKNKKFPKFKEWLENR